MAITNIWAKRGIKILKIGSVFGLAKESFGITALNSSPQMNQEYPQIKVFTEDAGDQSNILSGRSTSGPRDRLPGHVGDGKLVVPKSKSSSAGVSPRTSVDTDTDTINDYLAEKMRNRDQLQMVSKKRTVGCFKVGGCIKNRVAPYDNTSHFNVVRQQAQENPEAAFSYVKYNQVDELIDMLMQVPVAVHQKDDHERTLLHFAASKGNMKIVKLLIANNARVNEVDDRGNLPIHMAAQQSHGKIVKFLLDSGADPLLPNKDGLQPIHIACEQNDTNTLRILLEVDGIDVNAEGERGATPLHYCCIRDSVDCLNLLLEHGANIYLRDLESTYPIHVAVSNISPQCAKALFAYEERFHKDKVDRCSTARNSLDPQGDYSSRLSGAAELSSSRTTRSSFRSSFGPGRLLSRSRGKLKTVKKLEHLARSLRKFSKSNTSSVPCMIELTDCEGETPLHCAVTSGNPEMVKICLENNADVMAQQNDHSTPIHYACIKDDQECLQLMLEARPHLKEALLKMPNKNGFTPLHLAAVYNHEKLIQYLVQQGSPLEMTDGNGWTPLLLAAMKGAFQACIQLLRHGADPNAHDLNNRNLVHLLMFFRGPGVRTVLPEVDDEDLFKRLVNERDSLGSTPLHYSTKMGNLGATSAFVLRGASALERDNERHTPLHTAAFFGREHTCEKLLSTPHGMRAMNSPDILGRLPIHVAVEQGHVNVVKLFLDKGCVFRKCHLGNTPLHYVAIGGCIKTCRLLLQTNPSLLDQVNFEGMTALHYAARENNAQVLDHLLTSKAKIVPDKKGLYFVTYALQKRNYEVVRTIILHPRWAQIHTMLENTPQCPIDGFIRDMPTMCGLVLDQYIKEIGSVNSTDHEIVYDFTILQRPVSANEPPQKDPMRRMKLMVELQRGELLVHPLCTAYLERKWTAYGRWVQLITTTYFAILMAGITSLVVSHNPIRHVETLDRIARCSDLIYTSPKKLYMITVVAAVVLALTCADISIKLWQLFSQRLEYFKEMNNYLEFLLSLLALVYSALTLAGHITHQHSGLGVVVMFLAWFNFLLQMMRFGHVGIFVVMFLNVFATVGKCLIVFSLVFVAFALSFHVLFRIPEYKDFVKLTAEDRAKVEDCFTAHRRFSAMAPNNTENTNVAMELQSFQYIGLSLFKTLMMMLGEYEHTATVIEPLIGDSPITLNFPIITLLLYVAFVFLLPIIIMNLLIGLAVGDIDNVRKSAVHRLISQQVYWLAELEPKLMMVCHAKLYQPYWKRRTKRASASLGMNEKVAEVETGEQTTTYSVLRDLSQHVESVNYQIKLQTVRMAAVVEKLEVKTNEYTLDEGVYPGVLLGANEHSGKQKRKS